MQPGIGAGVIAVYVLPAGQMFAGEKRTHGPRTRCPPRRTHGPRTRCPPSGQDVPQPGGEMDCQTLTLQQIMDSQPVLLRTIAASISQHIFTNSKTLPETLLHKTVDELG